MAHATDAADGRTGAKSIGTGWRVFQAVALLTALSWLGSYFLMYDPFSGFQSVLAGGVGLEEAWGDIVFDLSPVLSVVIIAIALFPERLSFLSRGDGLASAATRAVLFALPVLWMVNVFVGPRSVMIDKLIATPLEPSGMIPFFAGVFLHVVFQHWFQAIAALTLALVPEQFSTLTESSTPAGVQCAVVNCE